MVVKKPGVRPRLLIVLYVLPANHLFLRVGLPGLEPGTSSLSGKHDALQEVSGVCKIPANSNILCARLFPSLLEIDPDCCLVAAHLPAVRDERADCCHNREYPILINGTSAVTARYCRRGVFPTKQKHRADKQARTAVPSDDEAIRRLSLATS